MVTKAIERIIEEAETRAEMRGDLMKPTAVVTKEGKVTKLTIIYSLNTDRILPNCCKGV